MFLTERDSERERERLRESKRVRERVREQESGRERGRHRIWSSSRLWSVSTKPDVGLESTNHEIILSQSQPLNPLSHPGKLIIVMLILGHLGGSVGHPTLDFGFGHGLAGRGLEPRIRLCTGSAGPAWDSPLCAPPPIPQINKLKTNHWYPNSEWKYNWRYKKKL